MNFNYYKYSFLQFIMQRHFITKKEKRELFLLYMYLYIWIIITIT